MTAKINRKRPYHRRSIQERYDWHISQVKELGDQLSLEEKSSVKIDPGSCGIIQRFKSWMKGNI